MTGNKLRAIRLQLQLSQVEVAKRLGVTERTLQNYEARGVKELPVVQRHRVDKLFMTKLKQITNEFNKKSKEINDV